MVALLNIQVAGWISEFQFINFLLPRPPECQAYVSGLINWHDQFVEMWPKVRVGVQGLVPECLLKRPQIY